MREHFGIHRSLEPPGVLPQQARVLDTSLPLHTGELLIEVEYLNIDSASFKQMREQVAGDERALADLIASTVRAAGKMHNPVTGSGGMLVGRVAELGPGRAGPPVGTRIATLVSLTLTPLVLDEIVALDARRAQVAVRGRAILFASGAYAEVPQDLPDGLVLSVLDVCGAPAWMARLARPGMRVVVLGAGGKSGMLACAQARRSVGPEGRVIGVCWPPGSVAAAADAGAEAIVADATDPLAVHEAVTGALGEEADLVFACTNVPGCEGAALLACRDGGVVVFFSMATSFSAAALTAEGLGRSCDMLIGNGFLPGHAELALGLVRADERLRARFAA